MPQSERDPLAVAPPPPATAGDTLRLFIALTLPLPVRDQLAGLACALRTGIQFTGARPRWCEDDAHHLTLAFLGDRPHSLVAPLGDALAELAPEFPPQRLEIRRLGVFPHWQRPRVLWAGIRDRTRLLPALHDSLHQRLAPFGYKPEDRPFRPHITLARFKDSKALAAIEKIVHDHEGFRFGPFEAAELVLFQSNTQGRQDPSAPRYTPLHAVTLCGVMPAQEAISS